MGLRKKAARGEHIENQRISRMLLDIAEFQSEAFHVQGERNILSDFGTCPPAVEEVLETLKLVKRLVELLLLKVMSHG